MKTYGMPKFSGNPEKAQADLASVLAHCASIGLDPGDAFFLMADAALERAASGAGIPVCAAAWEAAHEAVQGISALKASFELEGKEREDDREQERAVFDKEEKELLAKIDWTERNLANITQSVSESAQAARDFAQERADLESKAEILEKACDEAKNSLPSLEAELSGLEKDRARIRAEAEKAKAEESEQAKEADRLNRLLQELRKENAMVEAKLENLHSSAAGLSQALDGYKLALEFASRASGSAQA
jgi:chromosome segregation ATPase